MNLQSAIEQQKLREPRENKVKGVHKSRLGVARRVFQLAANGGFPYKKTTAEKWAKKWLSSKDFILMEIDINAAASPHKPKNPNRVIHYLQCSKDSIDPIVVDINKRKVGKSHLGFIPEVVKLDGKHRSAALLAQGHTRILAWVGCKAVSKLSGVNVIQASSKVKTNGHIPVGHSPIGTAFELHAAVSPSTSIPVMRQDTGEGGSRPKDQVHSGGPGSGRRPGMGDKEKRVAIDKRIRYIKDQLKKKGNDILNIRRSKTDKSFETDKLNAERDCEACGARSSGSLVDDSSNDDHKVPPDQSDSGQSVDPSDQLKWDGKKANNQTPGTKPGDTLRYGSPNLLAPGAGVGPRVRNTGASRSEMSRAMSAGKKLKSKGIRLDKIYQKSTKKGKR